MACDKKSLEGHIIENDSWQIKMEKLISDLMLTLDNSITFTISIQRSSYVFFHS